MKRKIVVHNVVMKNSAGCPTATVTDCDVGEWVPAECRVSCANSHDSAMPYKCGGWQEMKREIVVHNVVTENSKEWSNRSNDRLRCGCLAPLRNACAQI